MGKKISYTEKNFFCEIFSFCNCILDSVAQFINNNNVDYTA